jgi:hypothetical protein
MGYFLSMTLRLSGQVMVTLNPNGVWQAGDLGHVAVMRKEGQAHEARAQCFDACHKAQEARDFVFSDPRR